MINILIDTCVVIHIIRRTTVGEKCIEVLQNLGEEINIILSVVSKGELEAFAKQRNWGASKLEKLNGIFTKVTCIDIQNTDQQLLDAYSMIDGYSKRKIVDRNNELLKSSAKKMGKNDLWIAATAYVLNIQLLTSDGDFDHLNGSIIKVIKIV